MVRLSAAIAVLSVAGSAVAFFNQLVLAQFFGAGPALDAFLIATSLPLTLTGVLVGAMNFQLVPALALQPADFVARFSGSLFLLLFAASISISLLGVVLGPAYASFLQSAPAPGVETVVAAAARIAWLTLCPSILSAYFTARLQINGHFLSAAILAPVPALLSALTCIVAHRRLGILSISGGLFVGTILQCVLLGYHLKTFGTDLKAGLSAPRAASRVLKQVPLAITALLLFSIYPSVDAFWAPRIGESTMSYLGYGQRLTVGIGAILVAGASTAIFPLLSANIARAEHAAFRQTLINALRALLVIVAPLAAALIIYSHTVLTLFFKRGAFGAENVDVLNRIFPGMLTGMIAMCCVGLQFKALFAKHDLIGAAALSLIGGILYFTLSGIFSHNWGISGISIAYATTWWIIFPLAHTRINCGKVGAPSPTEGFAWKLFVVAFTAAGTAAVANKLLLPYVEGVGRFELAMRLMLCLSLSTLACWGCGIALHLKEIRGLTHLLLRRASA